MFRQKILLAILAALTFSINIQAQGDPINWCRGGLWTTQKVDFKVAKVRGRKNSRAYFYKDENDCPNGKGCRRKAYLIAGDEVIYSRSYKGFACVWYQPRKGSSTVGWIPLKKLSIYKTNPNPLKNQWLGNWKFDAGDLKIARSKKRLGYFKITGNAFWKGVGDNIHIGEVDNIGKPIGNKLSFGGNDKYDCRVKMQLVGKYLVVSDNLMCGGANVSFNGVYRK